MDHKSLFYIVPDSKYGYSASIVWLSHLITVPDSLPTIYRNYTNPCSSANNSHYHPAAMYMICTSLSITQHPNTTIFMPLENGVSHAEPPKMSHYFSTPSQERKKQSTTIHSKILTNTGKRIINTRIHACTLQNWGLYPPGNALSYTPTLASRLTSVNILTLTHQQTR